LCDDKRFERKQYLISEEVISDIKLLGFSFILVTLLNLKAIDFEKLKEYFYKILESSNWKNSIVEISNRRFIYDTTGNWV
jgi:hypothetical protein